MFSSRLPGLLLNHSKEWYHVGMAQHGVLEAGELLRDAGLRSTAPRRAVLEALHPGGHFDASELFEKVKHELPDTTLQTMYVVLSALTEAGLVRKIEPAGASAHYEVRVGDNHHHLLCTSCGRLEDVACAVGAAPCLTPNENYGFTIEAAEVTFIGLCPNCH